MPNNKIKPKRSYTANAVPTTSDLDANELAINWADGKAYTKDAAGNIVSVTLGGGGGGADSRWDLFLPPAPTGLTATAGNAQATVSWSAPSVLSQTPITDYIVQYSTNSGSTWTTFVETTIAITAQPSNQTAASGAATFSVTATVSPSGTATYQWEKSDDGGSTFAAVAGGTSATLSLTSLTIASDNNDQYRVVVSAVGATAVTSSAATLTVTQPPNAPTSLAATAGNAQLSLSWTAPSAPGSSAITGYTVEYTPSGGSAATVNTGSTATSYTLTGLTNGTSHSVRVRAVSAAGNGDYSTAVTATPANTSLTASGWSGAGTAASKLAPPASPASFGGATISVNATGTLNVSISSVDPYNDSWRVFIARHGTQVLSQDAGIADGTTFTVAVTAGQTITLSQEGPAYWRPATRMWVS